MHKLSPSDFAYPYEECKLCYYLKIKHGITQPKMPMPGVFSAMNTRLQGSVVGKNLQTISKDLPDGIVNSQEGWVESITVPGTNIFIKGKYDLAFLSFPPKWLEVPVDGEGFLEFAKKIDALLEGPMPEEGKDCQWCKYRHIGDTLAHVPIKDEVNF